MNYHVYYKDNHLYIEIDNQIRYIQQLSYSDYQKIKHYFN